VDISAGVEMPRDGSPPVPVGSVLPPAASAALRGPAVQRLLDLRGQGALSTAHVRTVAQCLGVSERTVWRWLAAAGSDPRAAAAPGSRVGTPVGFTVTAEVRRLLALWGGNVAAVHRELLTRARAHDGSSHVVAVSGLSGAPADSRGPRPPARPGPDVAAGPPVTASDGGPVVVRVPSISTLRRAIARDLTAGERAGLAGGERAARKHDVFLKRPRAWRNHVWEADHVQAPVLVDVDGTPRRPWITWFVDCATNAITGVAITPHHPSREAILAALRAAITREAPYGPTGGLPETVRVDRGRDFLSATVSAALGALNVTVEPLPAYTPHLKGTVESLNHSVELMHLAALPGYVHAPAPGKRPRRVTDRSLLMDFATFTADLLGWVHWWNTTHTPQPLDGRTPLQAWNQDPTPLVDIDPNDLWAFTLEDDGRVRVLTTKGVRWRGHDYVGDWMTGQAGRPVRLRWMPHHDHHIEVVDPTTGRRLGPAYLANRASPDQIAAVGRARAARARRLRRDLEAAERLRRPRYAATTTSAPVERLDTITASEAARELAYADHTDLAALALPDLIPPSPPPADWRTPTGVRADTRAPDPTVPLPPAQAAGPAAPADTDSPRRHP